jgi:hypothetical protein
MSHTDTDKPGVDVTAVEHSKDADIREQALIFKAFVVTVQHLFGGFHRLFQDVTDPRKPHQAGLRTQSLPLAQPAQSPGGRLPGRARVSLGRTLEATLPSLAHLSASGWAVCEWFHLLDL